MGLGLIAFGLVFFILPGYGMIDLMPDFIGALLIVLGLGKLRDIDGRLESARSMFMRLLFLDLIKTVLILPVYSTDETTVMTVTFIFSIICAVLLFSGFSSLFEGLYYVCSRCDSRKIEENSVGVKSVSAMFAILYYVFLMIPQLTVLSNPKYSMTTDVGSFFSLYDYRYTVTILCAVLSLALGIVFGYSCIKYILAVKKESGVTERLGEMYKEALTDKAGLLVCRRISLCFIFLFAGLFFSVGVRFEGVDIVPELVGFALAAIGFGAVKKDIPFAKKYSVISAVLAVLSAPLFVLCFYVADNYFRSTTVTDTVRLMYVLKSVCEAILFAMLAAVIFMIYRTAMYALKNTVGSDSVEVGSFKYEQDMRLKKSLGGKLTAALAVGLIMCTANCVMGFFTVNAEALWLVQSVLTLVYALYQGKVLSELYDAVESKLM